MMGVRRKRGAKARIDEQEPATRRERETSSHATAKSISIKHAERRSGDCARKAAELTSGDLPGRQKSAEGIVDLTSAKRGEAQESRRGEIESLPAFNESKSPTDTDRIMEEICEWENLKEAMWRVKANKGSAGIDGVTVDELPDYRDLLAIREQLLGGTYKPQPVKRVEIPKPDGGVRKLGIPTVPSYYTILQHWH